MHNVKRNSGIRIHRRGAAEDSPCLERAGAAYEESLQQTDTMGQYSTTTLQSADIHAARETGAIEPHSVYPGSVLTVHGSCHDAPEQIEDLHSHRSVHCHSVLQCRCGIERVRIIREAYTVIITI
jgi:hypothetical protein